MNLPYHILCPLKISCISCHSIIKKSFLKKKKKGNYFASGEIGLGDQTQRVIGKGRWGIKAERDAGFTEPNT